MKEIRKVREKIMGENKNVEEEKKIELVVFRVF